MSYELDFTDTFFSDVEKLRSNKTLIKKIDKFLDEIESNPITGTGKPEQLKGFGERSIWSRRINQKHRLVYEIFEGEKKVSILTAYGHYKDK